jgi:hypothetical protein
MDIEHAGFIALTKNFVNAMKWPSGRFQREGCERCWSSVRLRHLTRPPDGGVRDRRDSARAVRHQSITPAQTHAFLMNELDRASVIYRKAGIKFGE